MRFVVGYCEVSGEIWRVGSGVSSLDPKPGQASVVVDVNPSGLSQYIDVSSQTVKDRPTVDLPPPHALVGSDWIVPLAPAGTEVWLDGVHLGTTEAEDEEIAIPFPLPGLWRVDLRPPFPWREAGCNVEVSHAD